MAAPCRFCRVLRIGYLLGQPERHARVASHQLQQVRFKKTSRSKLAPVDNEKQNLWFFKKKKVAVQEVDVATLKPFPEDDVWLAKYYVPFKYDLVTAVQMHREACQASMLNVPSAKLNLTLSLDLRTKKKTKFMNIIKKTIVLPHNFDDGIKNLVMVFVKDEEGRRIAEELGANIVGGSDLVKMISKGEVRHDDFDHVVCHVDMLNEITTTRKFLRDLYPTKKNGNLGTDIARMVAFFVSGKTYESVKLDDAIGKLDITLGTLDMPDDHLMDNCNAFIEAICSHRSAQLGPFITSGSLKCLPSLEVFPISPNLLRPVYEREAEVAELQQEEEEPAKVNEDEDSDDEQPQTARKNK